MIGYLLNILIIIILKLLFQQPRPKERLDQFYAKRANGRLYYYDYGMPSGHAESTFFSTVYIWLATQNVWITAVYFIICWATIYQRLISNSHDIWQIIVGAILGSLFAYVVAVYVKRMIPGVLKRKLEEYGPR